MRRGRLLLLLVEIDMLLLGGGVLVKAMRLVQTTSLFLLKRGMVVGALAAG